MKTRILILLALVTFASCNEPVNADGVEGLDSEIVKIRGCEYIKSHVYLGRVYTHLGDCRNPIHESK